MLPILFVIALTQQDTTRTQARVDRRHARALAAAHRAETAQANAAARHDAALRNMSDAYADSGTANLVALARDHRSRNERLVVSYQADVTQRMGVGLHVLSRDRMLFGQELAAHIDWQRDGPSRVTLKGARERVPVATRGDHLPNDLDASVMWLVLDPSADYLRIAGDDADGFVHPLSENSEADYRFASGDTTRLTLPNGHTIRLIELTVRPRRADFKLMSGSLWFDADSYGLVRAVFAPARPFDIDMDGDPGDGNDVPAMLKPIRAEVKYVTLEYGLYETRWWMLRYFAMDLEAQAGPMKVPAKFERVYTGFRVQGGAEPLAGARRPAGSVRAHERDRAGDSADAVRAALPEAVRDSLDAAREETRRNAFNACVKQKADSARAAIGQTGNSRHRAVIEVNMSGGRYQGMCRRMLREGDDRWPVEVVIPGDTASLLQSTDLGPPILAMGDVINENELREVGREIGAIPQQPWAMRPQLPHGVGAILKNARYNRVESLSLGLNGTIDFGRLKLDGLARIGAADLEPNFELGLMHPTRSTHFRLGAYRRLAAANPDTKPFGVINSFGAFFTQRDDGEYFRTLGAELTGVNDNSGWLSWRLYTEGERRADVHTNVALPHLFKSTSVFRPNIQAQSAVQTGASITVRGNKVVSRSVLVGADVTIDGSTGTFDFARSALTSRATITGVGPLALGLEGSAGVGTGSIPIQSLFYLGGPATLRGYDGGALAGPAFWRGRAEAATQFPAARIALFTDMGWAGARSGFATGRASWGAGVGASFLDGIFRMDLSRRLSGQQGWRFDFYVDGIL